MALKVETLACQIVCDIGAYTRGRALTWVPLGTITARLALSADAPIEAALQHGVDQGWMFVEGDHTVCLTNAGRKRAKG